MPRKITIFLSAPPGDGLRPARDYFHEYIKPILVSAALDWEVIEGRHEGDVRAGLAEKIRKLRKRNGEISETTPEGPDTEDLVVQSRTAMGVRSWDNLQGDLVIGRHTWKEYVRGLHEGWLGPLDPPPEPPPQLSHTTTSDENNAPHFNVSPSDEANPPTDTSTATPDAPKKPSPSPPYVLPSEYSTSSLAPTAPHEFSPSTPIHFPHILGFLNTPIRTYRFLTRRYHADRVGHDIATFVLAFQTRPYSSSTNYASSIDPDSPSTGTPESESIARTGCQWEQCGQLEDEEPEWHKSSRKPNSKDEERKERVWLEAMVIDDRIGAKMKTFEMSREEEDRAMKIAEQINKVGVLEKGKEWYRNVKAWMGWQDNPELKGWEQGLVGEEVE